MNPRSNSYPPLPLSAWRETCATLQLWTQIVGKIRLALAPMANHWWNVALYVTARGLTTSPIPYGARSFQIDFDFIDHRLVVLASDGTGAGFALAPRTVAAFYRELMTLLKKLGIEVKLWTMPVEIPGEVIPFDKDEVHAAYDAGYAARFWRVLSASDRVFEEFRGRFIGKASPVHFFWGSFDLAVTRFSGRPAPEFTAPVPHLAPRIMREAYSREVSSAGFWPGGGLLDEPAFYSYAYPSPPGFSDAKVAPAAAYWHQGLGEFILPYESVRQDEAADGRILEFLESSYRAAADLGHWDRAALERSGQ